MKLIKDLGVIYRTKTSKYKRRYGLYECPICLNNFETRTGHVLSGRSKKCKNCSNRGFNTYGPKTINPISANSLYKTWDNQKSRCNNKTSVSYKNYGGRGIAFSKEFEDFEIWFEYVKNLPNYKKDKFSLDRIDNNKGYERGNLRWASKETQSRNTRRIMATNTSGYRGVHKCGEKWRTRIIVNTKRISLGLYATKIEAAHAYDKYVIENNLEHTKNF